MELLNISAEHCQSAEQIGRLITGIEHADTHRCAVKNAIDFCKFCLNTFHGTAGQRHTQIPDRHTLLIRQHTGRAVVARQIPFLRLR